MGLQQSNAPSTVFSPTQTRHRRLAALFSACMAVVLACSLTCAPLTGWADEQTTQPTTTPEVVQALENEPQAAAVDAPAAPESAITADKKPIAIIHTNDVHCGVSPAVDKNGTATSLGYAGLMTVVKNAQTTYGADHVALVDAGDAVQGKPIGTLSSGTYLTEIMNEANYTVATLGNHEFDYGMSQLQTLTTSANFPYVSCNFINLSTGQPVYDAYKTVDYGGTKVAFVGITTPESLTKSSPAHFKDENGEYLYGFCQDESGQKLYDCVQNAADEARAAGADYVVALGHLGESGVASRWHADTVIANTTGIDALIDGHSHEVYDQRIANKEGALVPLAQTGTQLQTCGMIVIDPATGTITTESVVPPVEQDPDMAAFVKAKEDLLAGTLNKVVASSQVDLKAVDYDADGQWLNWAVRIRETNLGDLVADAYRSTFGADIGFANGGGIRSDVEKGEITYGEAIAVQPFANELCMVETTGQTILDALEMSARSYPEPNGGFLQTSGLTYELREDIPSPVALATDGSFVSIEGERRVQNVRIGTEPIDPAKTYTIASIPYLLKDGGDGFTMFKGSTPIVDEGALDYEALISFINTELGGVIGSAYENEDGAGRILVTRAVDPEPTPPPQPTPLPLPDPVEPVIDTSPEGGALARTADSTSAPLAAASALALSALVGLAAATRARKTRHTSTFTRR